MIDNFKVIDNFLQFEEGTFYKFELLVRNTDGNNELYQEGYSETNKNILIKSWFVDNKDYYEKIKHEMITMADLTGARLYITLDRKDNAKLVQNLIHSFTDTLCAICNGQKPAIKNIAKTFASETSKIENSSKKTKTIMFDVDTQDPATKQVVLDYIMGKGQNAYILNTKKGYHIFCYKKFDHSDWLEDCFQNYLTYIDTPERRLYINKTELMKVVSVKPNELGLVYHPMKGLNFIIDWQTADQSNYDVLHKKEFKSLDEARMFLQILENDPNVVYIEKDGISVEDLEQCKIIGQLK